MVEGAGDDKDCIAITVPGSGARGPAKPWPPTPVPAPPAVAPLDFAATLVFAITPALAAPPCPAGSALLPWNCGAAVLLKAVVRGGRGVPPNDKPGGNFAAASTLLLMFWPLVAFAATLLTNLGALLPMAETLLIRL